MGLIQFFKNAFADMKASTKAQHEVDKANFAAAKAEAKANFEENKFHNTYAKAKADALQEALDKHDLEEVKAKKDDLEKTVQALATKVYQQAQQAQQSAQNENPSNGKHDDAVDADYTEN